MFIEIAIYFRLKRVLFFLFRAHIILNYLEMVSASRNRNPAGSISDTEGVGFSR